MNHCTVKKSLTLEEWNDSLKKEKWRKKTMKRTSTKRKEQKTVAWLQASRRKLFPLWKKKWTRQKKNVLHFWQKKVKKKKKKFSQKSIINVIVWRLWSKICDEKPGKCLTLQGGRMEWKTVSYGLKRNCLKDLASFAGKDMQGQCL